MRRLTPFRRRPDYFAPAGDDPYHPSHSMAGQWSSSGYATDTAALPERQVHATPAALSDGECQLGGYLLDRRILGRPVEGRAFEQLRSANQTVRETRRTLRHGRGNVTVDIEHSNGESSLRTEAGRLSRRAIPQKLPSGEPLDPAVRAVAAATTAQAGKCGEHAHVGAFLHAAKLGEGEHLYVAGKADHSWAELRAQISDRAQDIVMDPWAKGPAIFAEDGAFSREAHKVDVDHHYDRATGANAHEQLHELRQQRQWRMDAQLGRKMKQLGPDFRYEGDTLRAPTPVLSDAFALNVAHAMNAGVDPAVLAFHATDMAVTLGASGPSEIARAATRIAEVAADPLGYPMRPHPALAEDDDF